MVFRYYPFSIGATLLSALCVCVSATLLFSGISVLGINFLTGILMAAIGGLGYFLYAKFFDLIGEKWQQKNLETKTFYMAKYVRRHYMPEVAYDRICEKHPEFAEKYYMYGKKLKRRRKKKQS